MAASEKKKQSEAKSKKAEKEIGKAEVKGGEEEKKGGGFRAAALAVAVIVILLLVFFFVVLPSSLVTVPFSTFKGNFYSAQRVALLVTYYNQSQFAAESQCYTQLVQAIAHSRNASTMDFYLLNQTTHTCTYPVGSLGHPVSVGTNSSAYCINAAKSEPSIFLNYSSVNSTVITAYRLYVYGNAAYMARCPIAVDVS